MAETTHESISPITDTPFSMIVLKMFQMFVILSLEFLFLELRLRAQPMKDFDIYGATGKLEREANFFAANFLISDELALDEIHSCGADFFSTASTLNVPAPFFAFKLYSLVQRGNTMRMPVDLDNGFLKAGR